MSSPSSVALPSGLVENFAALSPDDQATVRTLLTAGQGHLFASWPAPGQHDEDKQSLLAQARQLDAQYPGGLQVPSVALLPHAPFLVWVCIDIHSRGL